MAAPTEKESYRHVKDLIIEQNRANQEKLSDVKRTVEEVHRSKIEELETLNKRRISLEKAEEYHLSAHLKEKDDFLDKESSAFRKRFQGEAQKQSQAQGEFNSYLEERQLQHEADLADRRLLLEEKRRKLEAFRAANNHEKGSDEENVDLPGREGPPQERKGQEILGGSKISQTSRFQPVPLAACSERNASERSLLPGNFSLAHEDSSSSHSVNSVNNQRKQEARIRSEDSKTDEKSMIIEGDENAELFQGFEENQEPAEEISHSLDDDLSYPSGKYRDMREARLARARERLEEQKQKVKTLSKKFKKETCNG